MIPMYRILLVEDEDIDIMAFQNMVAADNLNYDITISKTVKDALYKIKSKKFDVIVMDYRLRDGTAFDIIDLLSDTPIILTTGAGNESIAAEALKKGVYDYLVKNISHDYLKVIKVSIERAISHKRAIVEYQRLAELNKAIVDNSFDGFVVTNYDGTIEFVNETMQKLIDFPKKELINEDLNKLVIPEEMVEKLIKSVISGKNLKEIDIVLKKRTDEKIPIKASVIWLERQNKVLFCFKEKITAKLTEEIKYFRKFAIDHIRISLFKIGKKGPYPYLSEGLDFAEEVEKEKDILLKMAIYYSTALAQGSKSSENLGLYGPLPVPGSSSHYGLTYSFEIADSDTDYRNKGITFAFLVITVPKALEHLFNNRYRIEGAIRKQLSTINHISEIDLSFLKLIKFNILESSSDY